MPQVKRRTATCRSRKPVVDTSRTSGGRGGRAPAPTRISEGGRRSTEYHRVRFRRPGRHNGDGDPSSVPNCGVRQRSRSQLLNVEDRQRWWTRSRLWLETECRKRMKIVRLETRRFVFQLMRHARAIGTLGSGGHRDCRSRASRADSSRTVRDDKLSGHRRSP